MTDISEIAWTSEPGVNWSAVDSTGWANSSGTMLGPTSVDSSELGTLHHNTALAGTDQYIQAKIVTFPTSDFSFTGICLRHDNTQNADCYVIQARRNVGRTRIDYLTAGVQGTNIATNDLGTLSDGDVLAATVTGQSSGTVFKIWINPPGTPSLPSSWGAADWTYAHTSGTFKNDGLYVALACEDQAASQTYDDFYAGDYSPTSIPIFMNHYRKLIG